MNDLLVLGWGRWCFGILNIVEDGGGIATSGRFEALGGSLWCFLWLGSKGIEVSGYGIMGFRR